MPSQRLEGGNHRAVNEDDPVGTVPSPKLGRHNRDIDGGWLGLSAAEVAALEEDGLI
jgi:hypothetical protein